MPCSPKTVETKLHKVLNAWEDLSPARRFGGMTFAEFRTQTKPSLEARAEITRLENELTAATSQRDIADEETCRLLTRVINGVRGDVTHDEGRPCMKRWDTSAKASARAVSSGRTKSP